MLFGPRPAAAIACVNSEAAGEAFTVRAVGRRRHETFPPQALAVVHSVIAGPTPLDCRLSAILG